MIKGLFENSTITQLDSTVQYTQARHHVLVGNVANLDTPGYRTRDLPLEDFQEKLRASIQARQNRSESLFSPTGAESPPPASKESLAEIVREDKVNSTIEQQVLAISKNQHLHNMAIVIMSNQFDLMKSMIRERP